MRTGRLRAEAPLGTQAFWAGLAMLLLNETTWAVEKQRKEVLGTPLSSANQGCKARGPLLARGVSN